MATDLILQKRGTLLLPASPADMEALDGLSAGIDYRAVLTRAQGRSVRQHRLLWGLAKLIAENLESDPPLTSEGVVALLKLRTGHTQPVKLASGEYVLIPRSIAFAKLDQDQFNRFFERALVAVERDLIPGLPTETLRAEIETMIAPRAAA